VLEDQRVRGEAAECDGGPGKATPRLSQRLAFGHARETGSLDGVPDGGRCEEAQMGPVEQPLGGVRPPPLELLHDDREMADVGHRDQQLPRGRQQGPRAAQGAPRVGHVLERVGEDHEVVRRPGIDRRIGEAGVDHARQASRRRLGSRRGGLDSPNLVVARRQELRAQVPEPAAHIEGPPGGRGTRLQCGEQRGEALSRALVVGGLVVRSVGRSFHRHVNLSAACRAFVRRPTAFSAAVRGSFAAAHGSDARPRPGLASRMRRTCAPCRRSGMVHDRRVG
jgi:hypothetical protein